jgi:hypothetical protein
VFLFTVGISSVIIVAMKMKAHWNKLDKKYKVLFSVTMIGSGHFLVSILYWIIMFVPCLIMRYKGDTIYWSVFWPSIIAFVLFGLFAGCAHMAWKSKRATIILAAISILSSVICFAYETQHENRQLQIMTKEGCRHTYANWWWYDGPNL